MPKLSQRDALRRSFKEAGDRADKSALLAGLEALAKHASYPDERDKILVDLADHGVTSEEFPREQAAAKTERDDKRAAHLKGVAIRNEIDANLDLFGSVSAASDELKNEGHAEHRYNGNAA